MGVKKKRMTAKIYDITNVATGEKHVGVTASQIRTEIVRKGVNVSQYALTGKNYGDWKIEEHFDVDTREKEKVNGIYPFTESMLMEWNKLYEKFRKVIWVKEGGKKLKIGG